MVSLPAVLQYGQVKGRLVSASADSSTDGDGRPNAVAPVGTVRFRPSVKVQYVADGADPAIVLVRPVSASVDAAGVLRDSDGNATVDLIATDSAGLSRVDWQWIAEFNLAGGDKVGPIPFELAADAVVDLASVAPVDTISGGIAVTRGPAGLSAYEVAVEAGFVGTEADWSASLVGPKGDPGVPGVADDASVAALVDDDASLTAERLRAAFGSPLMRRAQEVLARLAPADNNPFGTLTADPPTVTVSSTATLTGRLVGPQGGEVTEIGSRGDWNTSAGRLAVGGLSGLDFYHTGTAIEFQIYLGTTGNYPAWIFVDGQPVEATPSTINLSSNGVYVKLAFGTSRRRRIEFICAHSGNWYGVRGASLGDTIEPAPRRPVVAWIGDSFWGGSNGTPAIQSSAFIAARQLGLECLTYELAFGGTGYVASGSFEAYGGSSHLAQLNRAQPDLIVVQGSVNDDGSAGIQAAASAAYASWASNLPTTPIVVFGPQPTDAAGTLSANRQANVAAVKAAASGAKNVIGFHDEIGVATGVPAAWDGSVSTVYNDGDLVSRYGSVWRLAYGGGQDWGGSGPGSDNAWALQTWLLYGTGAVGATAGDGSRDALLYSDGVHPTVGASEAYGLLIARKIREDLRAFSRLGTVTVD